MSGIRHRGHGLVERRRHLGEATSSLPKTPERIQVYARRASRGEEIFHPGDINDDMSRGMRLLTRVIVQRPWNPFTEDEVERGQTLRNGKAVVTGEAVLCASMVQKANTLAGRLKSLRAKVGISSAVLARRSGLARDTVLKLQAGHRRNASILTVARLADALGVTVAALMPQTYHDHR